jgi:hypothetical protein
VVWCRSIGSLGIVAVSCKWSTGPAQHYNRLSTRLAGHDGATCSHVLHAMMALVSGVLKTHEHNCVCRSTIPFFILNVCGLLRTAGHMTASESSPVGRRGLKP